MKRDASIELYRVVLMFLICLLHSSGFGLAPSQYCSSGLMWAVCGFVFISGWFGIKFKFSKWVRLFCLGVLCGGIALFVAYLFDIALSPKEIAYILNRQWFLVAYLMLMLFAPILNRAFVNIGGGAILPLIIIIGWNFIVNLNPILEYGPYTQGMGSFTFLMMITVYSMGRILRIKCDNWIEGYKLSTALLAIICVVNFGILVLGWRVCLGMYSSPFAMSMAIMMFSLFKRIKLPPSFERLILFVAPSTFSIYLLHSQRVGEVCIWRMQNALMGFGVPPYLFVVLSAIAVFSACLAIDVIRRAIAYPLQGTLNRIYGFIDAGSEKLDALIKA